MVEINSVRHTNYGSGLVPMVIVGDYKYVTTHLWATSETITSITRDLEVKPLDEIKLDPGGMYMLKIPHVKFEVDGIKFDVQHTKVAYVRALVADAKERIPGYIRIKMWHWFIIIPKSVREKLLTKLDIILTSDDELHSQITEYETLADAEKNANFFSAKLPRERFKGEEE